MHVLGGADYFERMWVYGMSNLEQKVLLFLSEHPGATGITMRSFLHVSQTTLDRCLVDLLVAGKVLRSRKQGVKGLCYCYATA